MEFPAQVQDGFGFELFLVQTGQHPPSAKPLKGIAGGTLELIENFDGDTIAPSIRWRSKKWSMYFTRSKRNRSAAQKRHRRTWR
jgi:hypothetical protein